MPGGSGIECIQAFAPYCRTEKSGAPFAFDIVIKPQLPDGNLGLPQLSTILLSGNYIDEFQNEPGLLEAVLIHEMGTLPSIAIVRLSADGWCSRITHPPSAAS